MSFDVVTSTDYDVVVTAEPNDDVTVVVDFEVETIDVPEQGPPGPAGAPGTPGKDGNTVMYGAGPPSSAMGKDGDFYIDTTSHIMYGPKAGGVWPSSGASLVGPRGNSVLYGAGAPTAGVGIDGDFYINTTTNYIYGPKASGAWPAGVSLVGPQGPQGIPGTPGARGSLWYVGAGPPGTITGQQNGDNYLDSSAGDVWQLIGGTWTKDGNLKGPQGPQGPPGVSGTTVYVSDTPPVGVPDSSLWWKSSNGQLYIRYNDGNSTQWVVAVPTVDANAYVAKTGDTMTGPLTLAADPASALQAATKQYVDNNAVSYTAAQALNAAQLLQARQNIYAAPFDAMAYSGIQLNGACEVQQFNGLNIIAAVNGGYVNDQWIVNVGSATAFQNAFAGTAGPFGNAFAYGLKINTTAAAAFVPGSSDVVLGRQVIEGYRCRRLGWGGATNAKPVTFGFWAYSQNVTGVCSFKVQNAAGDRAYLTTFTINAAATWEYKTITIPPDVTGTWNNGTGTGMQVYWGFACGSAQMAAAGNMNAWGNVTAYFAPTQTNMFQSGSGGSVALTGFTAHVGSQGPTALESVSLQRNYDQEFLACQRYWYRVPGGMMFCAGTLRTGGSAAYIATLQTPVPMRASPTVTRDTGVGIISGDTITTLTGLTASLQVNGELVLMPAWSGAAGTIGQACILYSGSGAGVSFDARM